jgi:hypothetical protein
MALLIRLLRVAAYSIITWLALAALWLGLPSPSREYSSHPGRYERDTLRGGRPLIRIYDNQAWNWNGYPLEGSPARQSFALSYKLEQKGNTTLLSLKDGLTINLNPEYIHSYPFISQEKYTLVKTGDQDGINPPWFAKADSTLLYWWIHGDTATLRFQVIWKDAHTVELAVGGNVLLGLNFETPESGVGVRMKMLNDVVVPRESSSPSGTYAIRIAILAVIAPTGLLVMGVVVVVGPILGVLFEIAVFVLKALGCYAALAAVVWVVRGRRPLAEDDFVSRLPGMEFFGGRGASRQLTRGRGTVWGPSGPIEVDNDTDRRMSRRPIHSLADFFRSNAPLDDLLATFESTRRWTEPIGWGDRAQFQRPQSRVPSEPDTGFGRHRKVYSEDGLEESGLIDLERALPEKPRIVLKK